jgi:hypothetical protein
MQKIPPPIEPRPKATEKPPEKPPEKPTPLQEKEYIPSSFFKKELKKEEYFSKLGLPKEEREKIGEILGDKKIFGELIEKGEIGKVRSLISELKQPGSSSDTGIREVAKKVREEIGEFKAKKLADILKEKFGL